MHEQIEQFVYVALKEPASGITEKMDIAQIDKFEITFFGTPSIQPFHERKQNEPVTAQFDVSLAAYFTEDEHTQSLRQSFLSRKLTSTDAMMLALIGPPKRSFTVDVGINIEIVDDHVTKVILMSARLKQQT
jgi:hypothetical protein